jgi:hypothetical protein
MIVPYRRPLVVAERAPYGTHHNNVPDGVIERRGLQRRGLLSLVHACEQFQQRCVQLRGDRIKNQYAGIVDTPFEAPHHIGMDSRLERQSLLGQVTLLTAFPNFFTEASKYRSCAHAQGSIRRQDAVQGL